jgi:hypothetical protein
MWSTPPMMMKRMCQSVRLLDKATHLLVDLPVTKAILRRNQTEPFLHAHYL